MPSIEILIAFFAATTVFAYMPGPAMLYASAQTIARGRRAGWMAALGIHIGGYAHVIAAAAGLALLFEVVPPLYTVLKLLGAAYLVWLGIKLFLAKKTLGLSSIQVEAKAPTRAFWESIIVEVLNPKTAIFYVAFLPQFTDAAGALPVWLQLLILGTFVNIMFSSADVICVLLADRITSSLRASRAANRLAQRIGGGVLVALGVNIALSRQ